jgi:primosomal protein N' (replication factor Y)
MLAKRLRGEVKRTQVYGENECPIEKIRENYRFQILLRSSAPADMLNAVARVTSDIKVPHNVTMDIDVDPVDLM